MNKHDNYLPNSSLVEEIEKKGFLKNKIIKDAFLKVRREDFITEMFVYSEDAKNFVPIGKEEFLNDPLYLKRVYTDRSLLFYYNEYSASSISTPSLIALMIDLAEIQKSDKVLEIGTGSGYSTAILGNILSGGGHVFSAEFNEDVFKIAKSNLEKYNLNNVYIEKADGGFGLKDFSPFDKIIVSCATADITKYWIEQLKIGGIIVAPFVTRGLEVLAKFTKERDNMLTGEMYRFVHFYSLQGEHSIISHYSYSKKDLRSLETIITSYAYQDEEFNERIETLSDDEINDFFLFLSLKNSYAIGYYRDEHEQAKRGYGIFYKDAPESGVAMIMDRKLLIWGNTSAHYMLLGEFEEFLSMGKPKIKDYRIKVYTDQNDALIMEHEIGISRKNSYTLYSFKTN